MLSYLLLATAGIHALTILYQTRPGAIQANRQWRILVIGLLLAALLGALFLPRQGGYIVGIVWLVFIIFPMYGEGEIRQAMRTQDWQRAQRWAQRISRVMLRTAWRDAAVMYGVMHEIAIGQLGAANDMLQRYHPTTPAVEHWFRWQRLNLQEAWPELRQQAEMALQQSAQAPDTTVLVGYLRAIAAINDPSAFLAAFERYHAAITRLPREVQVYCYVMLFATVGRPDLMARVQSLFRAAYPAYMWDTWLGSAYLNSGDQENARSSFQASMRYGDAVQRAFVQRYVETLQKASRSPLTAEQQASLARFEVQWSRIVSETS